VGKHNTNQLIEISHRLQKNESRSLPE